MTFSIQAELLRLGNLCRDMSTLGWKMQIQSDNSVREVHCRIRRPAGGGFIGVGPTPRIALTRAVNEAASEVMLAMEMTS